MAKKQTKKKPVGNKIPDLHRLACLDFAVQTCRTVGDNSAAKVVETADIFYQLVRKSEQNETEGFDLAKGE